MSELWQNFSVIIAVKFLKRGYKASIYECAKNKIGVHNNVRSILHQFSSVQFISILNVSTETELYSTVVLADGSWVSIVTVVTRPWAG